VLFEARVLIGWAHRDLNLEPTDYEFPDIEGLRVLITSENSRRLVNPSASLRNSPIVLSPGCFHWICSGSRTAWRFLLIARALNDHP
jgi:hypothetical protein